MRHTVVTDESLRGFQYSVLRALEAALVDNLHAETIALPTLRVPANLLRHCGLGMKRSQFRRYLPKERIRLDGDVVWCVLMGPEDYRLDLYRAWKGKNQLKVMYLFDTLPHQFATIRRIVDDWDVLITSFVDAVPTLEETTGRKWYAVEQGVPDHLFTFPAADGRSIAFSCYGRRVEPLHKRVLQFCADSGLYYDYTTSDGRHASASLQEIYRQYAWHLSQSYFTFCWPVELTTPGRAQHLSPITCRWFEAAAAGTPIVGKAPKNPRFMQLFGRDAVVTLDVADDVSDQLHDLWSNREEHLDRAARLRERVAGEITWDRRVSEMWSFARATINAR